MTPQCRIFGGLIRGYFWRPHSRVDANGCGIGRRSPTRDLHTSNILAAIPLENVGWIQCSNVGPTSAETKDPNHTNRSSNLVSIDTAPPTYPRVACNQGCLHRLEVYTALQHGVTNRPSPSIGQCFIPKSPTVAVSKATTLPRPFWNQGCLQDQCPGTVWQGR